MEASRLWIGYFWVAVVVFGGSAIARAVVYFVKPGLFSLYDVAISLCGIPVLFAVWGYIHNQPYLWRWLWQVLFVFVVLENVRFFFTPKFHETVAKLGRRRSWLVFGGVAALSLPMFFAHAIYAFGRPSLWG